MLDDMNNSIDYINNRSVLDKVGFSSENMSEEEKKQALAFVIQNYFYNGFHVSNLKLLKMITDFVPLENLNLMSQIQDFLQKYDIDKLIDADFNYLYLTSNINLSNLEKIKKYSSIVEEEDLKGLLTFSNKQLLEKYSLDQLIEYGIKDLLKPKEFMMI